MRITNQRLKRLKNKIHESRTRLMMSEPFIALVLMNMKFAATKDIKTISTNGEYILFSADFFDKLYNYEVDFILAHQVMHIVFSDISRPHNLKNSTYHHSCDIINNINLSGCGFTESRYPHLGTVYKKLPHYLKHKEITVEKLYMSLKDDLDGMSDFVASQYIIDSDELWGENSIFKYDTAIIVEPEDESEILSDMSFEDETAKNASSSDGDSSKSDKKMGNINLQNIQYMSLKILKSLNNDKKYSSGGLFSERNLFGLRKPQTDWKKVLIDFIQEEICDYSFTPPDRRFYDSPFFLPDFNDSETVVSELLFMIDTSGSMTDAMIMAAYSEINGAIEQFNGKLRGLLGFFDGCAITPKPFESTEELINIIPIGGGGTDFCEVFEYVNYQMKSPPSCIIILTDGYGEFPDESVTNGIPVLWIVNNQDAIIPWGTTARINVY